MNDLDWQFSYIRLSQGHLNLLQTCPPQFQRVYIERKNSPASPERLEKQAWGSRFHLLMQQRELGLPIEPILAGDPELQDCFNGLIRTAPEIFERDPDTWREAEHSRTLSLENYLLTVIYDLLIINNSKAEIFDWKTYLQPQNPKKLAQNWQTRLYLYVLTETSEYLPEQISMTYWFVKLKPEPKKVTYTYSSRQHQKTKEDLKNLLNSLDFYLENYFNGGISFSHPPGCVDCPYYQSLISSESSNENEEINKYLLTSIADIEEIKL